MPPTELDWVPDEIERLIMGGFVDYEAAREQVRELAEEEQLDADLAVGLLTERWQARIAEQRSWTAESDADRLHAAFAQMQSEGIAARMNFSCCGSCAPGELFEDRNSDDPEHSYVYFHSQDADGIGEGSACLGYGSFADLRDAPDPEAAYEQAAVAVGRRASEILTAHGLTVTWDGSLNRRLVVALPDWRARLSDVPRR